MRYCLLVFLFSTVSSFDAHDSKSTTFSRNRQAFVASTKVGGTNKRRENGRKKREVAVDCSQDLHPKPNGLVDWTAINAYFQKWISYGSLSIACAKSVIFPHRK